MNNLEIVKICKQYKVSEVLKSLATMALFFLIIATIFLAPIGLTADGTKARKGTIAADTDIYPMGTIMYIEGYGYGVVEDRGSAIQDKHIDLFFKSHDKALEWGNKNVNVKIWLPKKKK